MWLLSRQQENSTDSFQANQLVKSATTEIYDALRNERRRHIIDIVARRQRVPIRELAERIAARETNTSLDELDRDAYKRVYVAIYQHHIQELDDQGLVDYDAQNVVHATPDTSAARDLIATVADSEVVR